MLSCLYILRGLCFIRQMASYNVGLAEVPLVAEFSQTMLSKYKGDLATRLVNVAQGLNVLLKMALAKV